MSPVVSVESSAHSAVNQTVPTEVLGAPVKRVRRTSDQRPGESAAEWFQRMRDAKAERDARARRRKESMKAEVIQRVAEIQAIEASDSRDFGSSMLQYRGTDADSKEMLVHRAVSSIQGMFAKPGSHEIAQDAETVTGADGTTKLVRPRYSHKGEDILASLLGKYKRGFSKTNLRTRGLLDDTITVQKYARGENGGITSTEQSILRMDAMIEKLTAWGKMRRDVARRADGSYAVDPTVTVVERPQYIPHANISFAAQSEAGVDELAGVVGERQRTLARQNHTGDARLSNLWKSASISVASVKDGETTWNRLPVKYNTETGSAFVTGMERITKHVADCPQGCTHHTEYVARETDASTPTVHAWEYQPSVYMEGQYHFDAPETGYCTVCGRKAGFHAHISERPTVASIQDANRPSTVGKLKPGKNLAWYVRNSMRESGLNSAKAAKNYPAREANRNVSLALAERFDREHEQYVARIDAINKAEAEETAFLTNHEPRWYTWRPWFAPQNATPMFQVYSHSFSYVDEPATLTATA